MSQFKLSLILVHIRYHYINKCSKEASFIDVVVP